MRTARFLTVAGSAAAALIAVVAFIVVTPRSNQVEAATILNSFRATLFDGFRLSFNELGEDGIHVNGQLVMLFHEVPIEEGSEETASEVDFYLDATVQADETNTDLPGMHLDTAMSFSADGQWLHMKLLGIDDEWLAEEPIMDTFAVYLEQGVVLQLDGVWELLQDKLDSKDFDEWFDGDGDHVNINISLGGSDDDAAATPNVAVAQGGEVQVVAADGVDEAQLEQLLRDMLLGQADQQQFDQLVSMIEDAAQTVEVTELEPGLHLLTISEITPPADEVGAEDAEMLAALEVQMAYRVGSGIEWAELQHVGPYDGSIRIEPATLADTSDLFRMERVIEPGMTTVFDMSSLMPLLQID